jgi:hypothetical protein
MNTTLMRIVIELCAFFELADDEQVSPDDAVRELEAIQAYLAELSPLDQRTMTAFASRLAQQSTDERQRQFYLGFGESMHLSK